MASPPPHPSPHPSVPARGTPTIPRSDPSCPCMVGVPLAGTLMVGTLECGLMVGTLECGLMVGTLECGLMVGTLECGLMAGTLMMVHPQCWMSRGSCCLTLPVVPAHFCLPS